MTGARTRAATLMLAWLLASEGALGQAADPLQVRGWAAACTSCHGSDGRTGRTGSAMDSAMLPLAGAPREPLLAQLLDFKSGRQPATVMQQLARGYDDEQLRAIADHFSSQPPP